MWGIGCLYVRGTYKLGKSKTVTFTNNGFFIVDTTGVIVLDSAATFKIESTAGSPTIYPGATFKSGKSAQIISDRGISAQGTSAKPITFTSTKATPAPGDWAGITFNSGPNTLKYCTIKYATNGISVINTSTNTIQNCTFQNIQSSGILAGPTSTNPNSVKVVDCTFNNCGGGITIANGRIDISQTSSSFGINNNSWGITLYTGGKVYMKKTYVTGNTNWGVLVNGATAYATLSSDGVAPGYNHMENNGAGQVSIASGGAYIGDRHLHSSCAPCGQGSKMDESTRHFSALTDTIQCEGVTCDPFWVYDLIRMVLDGEVIAQGCQCGVQTWYHNHAGYNYIKGSNLWVNNTTSSTILAQLTGWGETPYVCPPPLTKFVGSVDTRNCLGGGGSSMAGSAPSFSEDLSAMTASVTENSTYDCLDALRLLANLVGPGGVLSDSMTEPWEVFLARVVAMTPLPNLRSLALAYLVQAKMDQQDFDGTITLANSILLGFPDDELWFHCQAELVYAYASKGDLSSAEATYSNMRDRGMMINPDATEHLGEFLELLQTAGAGSPISLSPKVIEPRRDVKTQSPVSFSLFQNYPNPFNPITHFRFLISDLQFVTLKVYNVLGQEVATLLSEVKEPGEYAVQWDASNLPSGVYTYRLTAGTYTAVKKMIIVK
ncbi:MAG: T9SS type A sorting domain-containing protein [Ignavibacteriae bacterium]|nr:T9SS type A sorting domain-containing protein [Ignavibacteriota bacterium]